ncbi:hypothetical protein BMF94_5773, partial [Rhodotorula taiwanensis]
VAGSAQILPLDPLLGTARKLGVAARRHHRLELQGCKVHLGTNDPRARLVLSRLYAIRLASATTESRDERDGADLAGSPLHSVSRQQGQARAGRKGQGGSRRQVEGRRIPVATFLHSLDFLFSPFSRLLGFTPRICILYSALPLSTLMQPLAERALAHSKRGRMQNESLLGPSLSIP